MFLPVSMKEVKNLGWDALDVVLITGDAYIDSPFTGVAVVGKYLLSKGFRVGVISQPAVDRSEDITALGEPLLYWGVSAGCVDSMVANYTASGKPRRKCDFTPGGVNDRRPDRASIVYSGLIRRSFKNTRPIILGGIEASLRRIAHYDFKTDKIRRSLLFDAKADGLIYGMGEIPACLLAQALKNGESWENIPGLCRIGRELPENAVTLPSFEEVSKDKRLFAKMFKIFFDNSDPIRGKILAQKTGDRFLIQNPPVFMTEADLDETGGLDYERETHPLIKTKGQVKAEETVRFSIPSHRGCFGGCSFCAIAVHQGRRVISRSQDSILKEAEAIAAKKGFKGVITDVGGPTGNMYGMKCRKMEKSGSCPGKSCLFPSLCPSMDVSHKPLIELLKKVTKIRGLRKVFAASGVRPDLIVGDKIFGKEYLRLIAENHISGQLKLAPESGDEQSLKAMKKPELTTLIEFLREYKELSASAGKKQFVTCYFMAAHPGSDLSGALKTKDFIKKYLDFAPEQVQIFTPTPSTWSTCMYYTGLDEEGRRIFIEKSPKLRERQKEIIMGIKKKAERAGKKRP